MTTIQISKGTKYLSDVLQELPINCIFDKGRVGAGGTHIALTSASNYIICVPFVSLIQNKIAQVDKYPNVLGVYGGISAAEIKDYLATTGTKKIMVTYDSLPRLMTYIDPKEYSLLVDEYHLLFTQYSFRRDAAISVLDNYTKFNTYCFMTATVLEDEFILKELKEVDKVIAEWEETKEVTIKSRYCEKSVLKTTVSMINDFLTGKVEGNAYIFVNSVEFIKKVVAICNLDDSNARAIWSANNKTETGLTRGLTTDEPKKINLLTSTVFEGADLYDKDGKIFIISDSSKAHTLVDISTSFQQIAGRIRNTKYWNVIHHFYTNTRYNIDVTYDEYKQVTEKGIKQAKENIAEYNHLSESARTGIITACETYVVKVDNIFTFDENLVRIDLYNFKITKNLYKLRVNLNSAYTKNGYVVEHFISNADNDTSILDNGTKVTFEEMIIQLKELYSDGCEQIDDDFIKDAFIKYPFLKEAINKLGFEGIEAENYIITNIKRKMINIACIQENSKVVRYLKLNPNVCTGTFISAAIAKKVMSDIYDALDIKKTAKGSDLGTYYEIKESCKRINGNLVKGYTIIREKIIIK